jgi:hypothetical protein
MNFNYLKRLSIILFFPASIVYSQSGKVVLVSMPDDRNPVETSIAINPKSPKNIIAAFFHTIKVYQDLRILLILHLMAA